MPVLHITTQEGETKDIDAEIDAIMMETLRDAGLVEGTCGGVASCGTCHVYFANAGKAGDRTEDEGWMLEGLEDFVEIKDGSRLCCQIKVTDAHDGVKLVIAPEA